MRRVTSHNRNVFVTGQVIIQIVGVGASLAYASVASLVILKVLDVIPGLGLRIGDHEEAQGMDVTAHGERAHGVH